MKILIISHAYAPLIHAQGYRWTALSEHWAAQGHTVDVVCAWSPGLAREEVLRGVRIHRAGGTWLETLRARLRPAPRPPASGGCDAAKPRKSWIRRLHDLTWKRLYWPDFACLWYFPALRLARRLAAREGHEKLLTSALPFTANLIGCALKRDRPSISWLADYADPFCFLEQAPPNNLSLYRSLNYAAERRIFKRMDEIALNTDASRRRYAALFPESAGKMFVVGPLFASKPDMTTPVFPSDGTIRLAYIGTVYVNLSNVDYLLRLFSRLLEISKDKRLELHFFGAIYAHRKEFDRYPQLLGSKIFLHGPVPRPRASRAVLDADISINIGNFTNYQLSSKLAECIGFGKPILNIMHAEDDCAVDFLKDYPSVLSLLPARDGEDEALERLARFIAKPPRLNASQIARLAEPHQIDAIAAAYSKPIAIAPEAARRAE